MQSRVVLWCAVPCGGVRSRQGVLTGTRLSEGGGPPLPGALARVAFKPGRQGRPSQRAPTSAHHIASPHLTSHDITSPHLTSYHHIASHRITSHRIASHHIEGTYAPGIQMNVLFYVLVAIYHNALPPNITPSSSPGTLSTSTLYDCWQSIKFPFFRPTNGAITCTLPLWAPSWPPTSKSKNPPLVRDGPLKWPNRIAGALNPNSRGHTKTLPGARQAH